MMRDVTLELAEFMKRDGLAEAITSVWDRWNNDRSVWLEEKQELRNYLFQTDTSTTSNSEGRIWSNNTPTPKICNIRDNLHSNYISAAFPNDNWLKWEGYSLDDEVEAKRMSIQAYMENKTRTSGFRTEVSKLLYDYIDYGVAFGDVIWVNSKKEDPATGELIDDYVGPKLVRISPTDIVFNPTAQDFEHTPKIVRSLLQFGEVKQRFENGETWLGPVIEHIKESRAKLGSFSKDDFNKQTAYSVDGFNNMYDYYTSGFVEFLEFEGTLHDPDTGEIWDDHVITVVDRQMIARKEPIPAWKRGGMKVFTSWRKRPDNLYGMGPLDNLVGMQYRLDHLENAKADAWDLIIEPMWKVVGDVPDFEFYPGGKVEIPDSEGDIAPLTKPDAALAVNNELAYYMNLMEEFAGAPKQAMGIRTPGEKTAYEVQSLENAAGRIFQEKITQFEIEFLEPALNNMLQLAVKNMGSSYVDTLRVVDASDGVASFINVTKDDIQASGVLRPIGARHFSQRAQLLQNLNQLTSSVMWQKIERHYSDIEMAKLVEDALQINRFDLVSENVAMFEQAEAARLANTMQDQVEEESITPVGDEEV